MSEQHPTPPVTPAIARATLRARPGPTTGRVWMPWDRAMQLTGQSAEFQDTPTLGGALSANQYTPRMVGRTPGN